MDRSDCAACGRTIDASARTCPFCGANPETGARIDTQSLLRQMFSTKEMSPSESVIHYARQRQGIVIAVSIIAAFFVLAMLHQFVTRRNATEVTDSPAIPLSELTDMTTAGDEGRPLPMPQLEFQNDGRPQAMRTYIVEPGAVAPPEAFAQPQPGATTSPGNTPSTGARLPAATPLPQTLPSQLPRQSTRTSPEPSRQQPPQQAPQRTAQP